MERDKMGKLDEEHIENVSASPNQGIPGNQDKLIVETTLKYKNIIESSIFTGNNAYFLVFVSIALIIAATVTFFRHRQQKLATERKEQEYLRYFHSVLPHSQIYGNLNEIFSKPPRRKGSWRDRSFKRKKSALTEEHPDIDSKLNGLTAFCKKFKYRQHTNRTVSEDPDVEMQEEEYYSLQAMEVTHIEHELINETGDRSEDHLANNEVICQKFVFTVPVTDNMVETHLHNTEDNIVCQNFHFAVEENTDDLDELTNDSKAVTNNKVENGGPRVHFSEESNEGLEDSIAEDTKSDNGITETTERREIQGSDNVSRMDLFRKHFTSLFDSTENMQVTAL